MTMKAAWIEQHGDFSALQYTDRPRPEPGPGEVLVEVQASGLNHLDLWVRRGVPGHQFPLPLIPGCDGAGVIREVGAGVALDVGSEVILAPGVSSGTSEACALGFDHLSRDYGILGETRDGTCAEYCVVPARNAIPKPAGIPFEVAGCFALVALTSWTMLMERARVQPGESVLVIAGTSGVGSLAIQIAKLAGCHVIATAGSDEKCAKTLELGADHAIHHGNESIASRVKEFTSRRGVDVVFEHVGEATWEASLRSLAWGGRLVTCGATTGAAVQLDLRALFFKNITLLGSTMGSLGAVHKLVRLLGEGKLKAPVDRVLPLSEVRQAHQVLEERQALGKVVLVPDTRNQPTGETL